MKSVRLQSAKALRAATFTFALALGAGLTACADAGPEEENEEAVENDANELDENEADPQAQIITGVRRDTDPGKRFGGFPRIGTVTRTNHTSSSSHTGRTVSSGSSSSTGRTTSTSSSGIGRTVTTGGTTIRR